MNGGESLVKTFLASGVDVCFANPGTSEMHFVAALDAHPEMRCALCMFEGGASGAADGYFRMTGRVAATLLHLAPGFGNAFANLHNARKAGSGIVNVMGDHAAHHLKFESPLRGNTAGISAAVSHWTRSTCDSAKLAEDGAEAIRAARSRNGQIATLILPADAAWGETAETAAAQPPPPLLRPDEKAIAAAGEALQSPGAALFVGGAALRGETQELAARICERTGALLMAGLFLPRMERGAGRPRFRHAAYQVETNGRRFADIRALVLCGARRPVNFFAYPGKPSLPESPDCRIMDLCDPEMDIVWTIEALADRVGARSTPLASANPLELPDPPSGEASAESAAQAIAALMPEGAIVVNEAVTSGLPIPAATATAHPHDLLTSTGGAIGQGLPVAVGAAVACPDRPVIALTGDGSAMYTLQSLWTMARERLDVTVVVYANRGYQILRGELAALGIDKAGKNACRMFDFEDPALDWASLARGHGMPGQRTETAEAFTDALRSALAESGPHLIEMAI